MNIQQHNNPQLNEKLGEVPALLEQLMIELRVCGYEKHDQLIKRALLMQKELQELQKQQHPAE